MKTFFKKSNNDKSYIVVPPKLSIIYPDIENGPHQKFQSEKECLSCHIDEKLVENVGIAPKINHEIRRNCTSCHLLPKMQY